MNHLNRTTKIISGIVILLIVAGGAFYGGMLYGKNQGGALTAAARANFAGIRGSRTGVAVGAGFISGNIISSDASSITLQLPSGTGSTGSTGSKIIFFSSTTQISKSASGTASDLAAGTSVSVTGTTNPDGSITAQSIQIRPTKL
jgi:hypothetical protein